MTGAVNAEVQHELEQLYARYATLLDDGPLDDWPELFTEDALYLLQPRDNHDLGLPLAIMRCESRGMLRDRVRAVEQTVMHEPRYLRHHITNVSAAWADGALNVVAHYSVIEVLTDTLPRISSCGRYLDRVVRCDDGMLRFEEKRCVYDSVLVPNTVVYPV